MINKFFFYGDSKRSCIFKSDFFPKLICIFIRYRYDFFFKKKNPELIYIFIKYKSDFFFQNPKLICIFIKYRTDF